MTLKNTIASIIMASALVACTDEDATRSTLRAYGFTKIKTTGYALWGCSKEDEFNTGFRAVNPQGATVEGVVCCGWFKNCTVRF